MSGETAIKKQRDPNHGANTFLSVRDVFYLIGNLKERRRVIANLKGRVVATERRYLDKLVAKLEAVKWR